MAVLSEQCAVKKEERDRLQEKYKEIEIKLSRAEVLMKSLGEEQVSKAPPPPPPPPPPKKMNWLALHA